MKHDNTTSLPLSGVRVVEFTHMVMGPTCGMILADLGAEVIKVEPPGGDKTRRLPGLGMGFFRTYNRNKQSVVLDIDTPQGREDALRLIATADVLIENFRPGRMATLGLDYASLETRFPRLIYASHKGFLPGPYEHRAALDEVVQMMGGLAYMTGPVGRPLRAGAPVNDMMGGMFGALGVQSALIERARTGRGQEVQSSLFENCVWLCSPHIAQFAMSGEAPPPLTNRVSAWSVYDVFTLAEGQQLFIAATSDKHFQTLCQILDLPELAADPTLQTNAQRVPLRPALLARLGAALQHQSLSDLSARLEAAGLPYAPIRRPDQLVDDPHLVQSGGLATLEIDGGGTMPMPLLPLRMGGRRLGPRHPIASIGQHTSEVLESLLADDPLAGAKTGAHAVKDWMMSRRTLTQWALMAPAMATAGCSALRTAADAGPVTETRDLGELHKAALAEGGQLTVYGGGDLPNGAAGTEQAFMKRFPGMKIRILVDRSKYQGVRIDNQLALGRLQCDVVHILATHYFDRWKSAGELLPYKPLGWEAVEPDWRDADGTVTAIAIYSFSTLFNTSLMAEGEAPREMSDFLDPKFRGRIALTYPQDDDSILFQFHRLVRQYGWDYVARLARQDVAWNRGSGVTRQVVQRGERALSFTTSGPLVPAPGPLRFVLPKTDSFLSWAHPAAIFRRTRHPEAARLYMCWQLSQEVQGTARQWSVRRDMPLPTGFGPLSTYNTSPRDFREFLRDRAAAEQFRDQLEQYIGPMNGSNPTNVVGIFPEGG